MKCVCVKFCHVSFEQINVSNDFFIFWIMVDGFYVWHEVEYLIFPPFDIICPISMLCLCFVKILFVLILSFFV